jgi:hypothetical protein
LDNNDDKLVRILSLLVILASLIASDAKARYHARKLGLYVQYWLRHNLRQFQQRKRELDADHSSLFNWWPQQPPKWWNWKEEEDAAIPVPSSE